jgi:hypothetical protein
VSLSKPWILVLSLTLAGCGGGGGGDGGGPDAASPETPDAGPGPGAPDAGAPPAGQCESYCSAIMTNCTGANAQYADMTECMELCGASGWVAGVAGADDGNTLSCRLTHASDLAAADPDQHCASAGPAGGGTCGSLCENYCAHSAKHCDGQHSYRDYDQCLQACDTLLPQQGNDDDNSVQCRVKYVLEAATADDAATACAASDLHGNDTCGSWCEVYCDLMDANCSGQPAEYTDSAACLSACQSFSADGQIKDDMGDTVQCRIFHAGVPAMLNAETACGHAGESPTNYCIDVSPL